MTNVQNIKVGLKIIGTHIEIDNVLTDRLFNHGCPWEITKVEYSHRSEQHEHLGVVKPPRSWYRLYAKSVDGFEQSIASLADNEGVIEA